MDPVLEIARRGSILEDKRFCSGYLDFSSHFLPGSRTTSFHDFILVYQLILLSVFQFNSTNELVKLSSAPLPLARHLVPVNATPNLLSLPLLSSLMLQTVHPLLLILLPLLPPVYLAFRPIFLPRPLPAYNVDR